MSSEQRRRINGYTWTSSLATADLLSRSDKAVTFQVLLTLCLSVSETTGSDKHRLHVHSGMCWLGG